MIIKGEKMNIILEQSSEVYKDAQINRLIKYYELLSKMQSMPFKVEWDYYMGYAKDGKQNLEIYKSFFKSDDSNEEVIKDTYDVIIAFNDSEPFEKANVDEEMRQATKHIWKNIIQFLEREANWEKRIYDILKKTAENHPLIAKAIVIILTGILLGLAEDCIHDAIQMKNQVDMLESLTSIIDDGNKL